MLCELCEQLHFGGAVQKELTAQGFPWSAAPLAEGKELGEQ